MENTSEISERGHYKGDVFVQWTFPEYIKYERGPLWYVLAIGISFGLLIYAITTANFLFALMILLLAVIVLTHHHSEPADVTFTIYQTGLQIGTRFFLFRELDSFAVVYEPPLVQKLYIKPSNHYIRSEISIPLDNQDPVAVRAVLLDYVAEDLEHETETSADAIARLLKI